MGLFDKDDKPAGKTAFDIGMRMLGVVPPVVTPKDSNGIQAGSDWMNINKKPDEMDVAIHGGKKR